MIRHFIFKRLKVVNYDILVEYYFPIWRYNIVLQNKISVDLLTMARTAETGEKNSGISNSVQLKLCNTIPIHCLSVSCWALFPFRHKQPPLMV